MPPLPLRLTTLGLGTLSTEPSGQIGIFGKLPATVVSSLAPSLSSFSQRLPPQGCQRNLRAGWILYSVFSLPPQVKFGKPPPVGVREP